MNFNDHRIFGDDIYWDLINQGTGGWRFFSGVEAMKEYVEENAKYFPLTIRGILDESVE